MMHFSIPISPSDLNLYHTHSLTKRERGEKEAASQQSSNKLTCYPKLALLISRVLLRLVQLVYLEKQRQMKVGGWGNERCCTLAPIWTVEAQEGARESCSFRRRMVKWVISTWHEWFRDGREGKRKSGNRPEAASTWSHVRPARTTTDSDWSAPSGATCGCVAIICSERKEEIPSQAARPD